MADTQHTGNGSAVLASGLADPDYRLSGPNVELQALPEYLKKDCLLFYYPETEALARQIVESTPNVELGRINWRKFADGFPNLYVQDAHRVRNRHVAFLASFQDPGSIFEQLSIIYQLPRMFVGSFTLVLPYFPTGTAERVEAEGDVATAFTLARILSDIPLSRGGPTSLVIFDIHALQERFYFGDTVLPLFESGIPLVQERIQRLPDAADITIAYPDEGAWKRFHSQFNSYPEVICTKVRDGDKRIVRLKEGHTRGRHVVIVDDLVQSGGTLLECQKLLKSQGAAEVSAFVSHGVFPNESWRKFTREQNPDGFKYFWISDSCPQTVKAIQGLAPFEIISLAGPIAAALLI
ncbi:hypothetical protein WJX73_010486 [Symbiochloris irregularis]|uniref:ribose-phosphate diphosphokinase n=1 Tax=Symbiochloris irregularis TaxID=706552 RepID=A0AAW1PDV5_9CHLO